MGSGQAPQTAVQVPSPHLAGKGGRLAHVHFISGSTPSYLVIDLSLSVISFWNSILLLIAQNEASETSDFYPIIDFINVL